MRPSVYAFSALALAAAVFSAPAAMASGCRPYLTQVNCSANLPPQANFNNPDCMPCSANGCRLGVGYGPLAWCQAGSPACYDPSANYEGILTACKSTYPDTNCVNSVAVNGAYPVNESNGWGVSLAVTCGTIAGNCPPSPPYDWSQGGGSDCGALHTQGVNGIYYICAPSVQFDVPGNSCWNALVSWWDVVNSDFTNIMQDNPALVCAQHGKTYAGSYGYNWNESFEGCNMPSTGAVQIPGEKQFCVSQKFRCN